MIPRAEVEVGDLFQGGGIRGIVTQVAHDELGFLSLVLVRLDDGGLARVDVSEVKFGTVH
jgi:hypothetical protein